MAYTVEVDKDACISAGQCVAGWPEAFAFDPDELAEVQQGAAELTDADRLAAAGAEVDPFGG